MNAVECPSCNVTLSAGDLAEGWCDQCGKKIPPFVLTLASAAGQRPERTPAPRPEAEAAWSGPSSEVDAPATADVTGPRTVITLRGRDGFVTQALPSLCMCCGARATHSVPKKFAWFPLWTYALAPLGGLPFALVLTLVRKMMTVKVPLCDRHRYPWLVLKLFGGATLAYLLILPWFVIYLSVAAEQAFGRGTPLSLGLLLAWAAGIPLWFVAIFVAKRRSIHVRKITPDAIKLGGVGEAFAARLR